LYLQFPAGWYTFKAGTASTTYAAGTGTGTADGLYSFGSTSASDRALGCVFVGGAAGTFLFGVNLKNADSTQYITGITVAYTGEQWRKGVSLLFPFQSLYLSRLMLQLILYFSVTLLMLLLQLISTMSQLLSLPKLLSPSVSKNCYF
jgi:hypothetical protein